MTSADSMKIDTTALFYTTMGRRVYGGGGIIPDVFVPIDTTKATGFYLACNRKAVPMRFASSMFDRYRKTLAGIGSIEEMEEWFADVDLERQFLDYAASSESIVPRKGEWEESKVYMIPQIKGLVGRYSKLGDEAFYRFYLPIDDTIQAALKHPGVIE